MRNASSSPSQATERGWFLCSFASLMPDRRGSPQYYIPATFDTWQWSPMVEVGLPRNSGRLEVERGGRKVWETLLFACASPQALKRIQDFWLLLSLSTSQLPLCWSLQVTARLQGGLTCLCQESGEVARSGCRSH